MDIKTLERLVNSYLNGTREQLETLKKERATCEQNLAMRALNENMTHYFKGEAEALETVLRLINL